MARSQPVADIRSVLAAVEVSAGAGAVVLYVIAWWGIFSTALGIVLELVILIDDRFIEPRPWEAFGIATSPSTPVAFLVWFATALIALLILGLILGWLGRLRRLWVARERPPRMATAVAAVIWMGLAIFAVWLVPVMYHAGDQLEKLRATARIGEFFLDMGLGLVLLATSMLSGRGARRNVTAST